ncbi:MAG: D-hexose-6-phosphate mutarotase, partial [Candidatus Rokuibacteriota bacterium]
MSASRSIDALQARFGVADVVRFELDPNRLARAVIATPQAEASLYLQGAHVTQYRPRGQAPVLFLSARSAFVPGKAIRGGVPVIFPWFGPRAGDPTAPMHGFARVAEWDVEAVEVAPDGSATIRLRLDASAAMRAAWPQDFSLRYRVGIGPALALGLEVRNASASAFTFEEALHTYLAVADVRQASLSGLSGTIYIDKTDEMTRKREESRAIRLAEETDRVYLGTRATCALDDPRGGRRLVVDKQGSEVTVIWNPWMAKAATMTDLAPDEWPRFVCIETANAADHAVALAPGARHE